MKRQIHMKRHIREMHVLGKIFNCPEAGCNQVFRRSETLAQHARLHQKVKPFQCMWCEFTGAQQNNIRSHVLTAHKENMAMAQSSGERYWRKTGTCPSFVLPAHNREPRKPSSTQPAPLQPEQHL